MPVIPALCRGEALAIWEVQGQSGIEEIKEEKEKGFSINLSMGIEGERESRKGGCIHSELPTTVPLKV